MHDFVAVSLTNHYIKLIVCYMSRDIISASKTELRNKHRISQKSVSFINVFINSFIFRRPRKIAKSDY
jgi:hypothetical protein